MIRKIMDETNKGFMKHLGGLELKQISDTQYEFIVEVKEIHLNTGKLLMVVSLLPLQIQEWAQLLIE